MDIVKRTEIEEKLRKLIEDELKKEVSHKDATPKAPCNVIRRRKGEEDKRIYALT
ncbi:hypothetical protein [Desulfococcus sp.]|uniref:hypothetical protein n=1 Tax=Desulfococcus sp. TaxID=2025834 RepID=UPI003593A418